MLVMKICSSNFWSKNFQFGNTFFRSRFWNPHFDFSENFWIGIGISFSSFSILKKSELFWEWNIRFTPLHTCMLIFPLYSFLTPYLFWSNAEIPDWRKGHYYFGWSRVWKRKFQRLGCQGTYVVGEPINSFGWFILFNSFFSHSEFCKKRKKERKSKKSSDFCYITGC